MIARDLMLYQPFLAMLMVVVTAMIQLVAQYALSRLPGFFPERSHIMHGPSRKTVITLAAIVVLLTAHLAEVMVWALRYYAWGELGSFANSIYFSLASFTTVGAGELVLSPVHRFTGALEAAAGMLMFGWSTALLVGVIQRAEEQQERLQRVERAEKEES